MNPTNAPLSLRAPVIFHLLVLGLSVSASWSSRTAQAEVRITEVDINDTQQRSELFNTGPDTVNLSTWTLQNEHSSFPLNGSINPNQFRVFNLPLAAVPLMIKRGDCLELFDANLDAIVDEVIFGDEGGGPLDLQSIPGSSLARTGGSADPGGVNSATSWSVDFTSTFGSANNAPPPNFTPSIRINEIIPQGGNVLAEVTNVTGGSVNLGSYRLTTGQASLSLSGIIPSGGFAVFNITGLIFDFSLNLYLFTNADIRIDQMGLTNFPGNQTTWLDVIADGQSLGRFPDGNGPGTGFNLSSSGFPSTLQRMAPSPGQPNTGNAGDPVPLSRFAILGIAVLLIALANRRRPAPEPG